MVNGKPTPAPTLRRLATYHHFLKQLHGLERDVVSCTHIANELRLDPTQVRKDIEMTGIVGKSRVGYEVVPLIDAIEEFLGWNNTHDAFLVGAGHLGSALVGYSGFQDRGLNIVAVFDSDPAKIGTQVHGREVLPIEKLPNLAQRMYTLIGVIAVPAEAAQSVADLMVSGGIRAIWNFAPWPVLVHEQVVVENVRLSSSLAVLTNKLVQTLKLEKEQGDFENATVSSEVDADDA
ncbi:MAG: redox-sensing transcriptional repressor Rex [Phycisphaerae bacterium]|nr:redox-sensing transcriptional repressor Rex [Phycisphaerae bacterium]